MSAIDRLQKNLQRLNQAALTDTLLSDTSRLEEELPRLRAWVGGGSGLDAPTEDRIVAALRAFHQSLKFDGLGQARLVCYGCTQSFGSKNYRLIEDRQRFVKLLDYVDGHHDRPRPFRKCYRGLLNGYFSYDPENNKTTADGKQNWKDLRNFLHDRKDFIKTPDINPTWVTALLDHHNLLTDNPCQPYGLKALHGDRSAFNDIRSRLEITDDSWLVKRLILAQIDAATELSDSKFKSTVDLLLDLLREHELLVDISLSKLINRYADCSVRDLHPGLRDFSVTHWRNPWLPSNTARWGSVRPDSREMISAWLKLRLIGQFFSLLAEDGSNDTRRVEFWKQYHDEIDDMYFALGNNAMNNQSRDFREIRKAMEGRLLQLHSAGSSTNNAFIMMIRDYAVVEFGSSGNAAFIFNRWAQLPFQLTGHIAGNSSQLKNQDSEAFVDRLVHRDTNDGEWEEHFEEILNLRVGIQHAETIRSFTTSHHTAQTAHPVAFSDAALKQFGSEHGLIIKDNRDSGGALWAEQQQTLSQDARHVLETWGFRWSERRQAFYKGD